MLAQISLQLPKRLALTIALALNPLHQVCALVAATSRRIIRPVQDCVIGFPERIRELSSGMLAG